MPEQKDDISISNLLQAQRELLMGPGQPAAPQPAAGSAQQTSGHADDDTFVNIRHYAYLVYSRKWWVLLVTLLVVGAACLYGYQKKEVYESTCQVRLNDAFAGAGILGRRQAYYDPESLALVADSRKAPRELNKQLIKALEAAKLENMKKAAAMKLAGTELSEIDAVIAKASNRKAGFPGIGQVRVGKHGVTVTARHVADKSRRAAVIIAMAKARARAMAIERLFLEKISGDGHLEQLEKMVEANDTELRQVAAEMAQALKQKPERAFSSAVRVHLDTLNRGQQALARTRVQITEIEERIKALEKRRKDPIQTLTRSSNPELQGRLLNLRTQLAQMRAKYQPDHPKLKAKLLEIGALEEHMKSQPSFEETVIDRGQSQIEAEIGKARADIAALEARRKAQEESIRTAKQKLSSEGLSEADIQYATKVRQHSALEQMNIELRRKLREARLVETARKARSKSGDNGIVTVMDPGGAIMIGAGLGQTVGFAAILGLVMGVLLALLLEHLDDTVRNEVSARRVTNLPVIAKLPRFEGSDQKRFISPAAPRSDVAETFKFFHNHVRYSGPNAPEKCLQITSPGPEEGKSYVAVNLALSFASEGNRVCFVDADLRRSRTHERLDVLRPSVRADQGLCGYLDGALSFEEAVIQSEIENLSLILAGGRATNPPRLLRSDRMQELLERLKAEFDVVIVDAPPVLPVVDSAIISSLVRATLLVVRYGVTHQGDLAESAGRLVHVNAPLVGVAINAVHGAAAGYYYGRYRYRYRYRYGSGYGYGY